MTLLNQTLHKVRTNKTITASNEYFFHSHLNIQNRIKIRKAALQLLFLDG
jgi:hypothetical protein